MDTPTLPNNPRIGRGVPLARLLPNMLTLMSLCSGLTAMRYALHEKWEAAALAIVIASVFDILDGRVARMLNITSKFGAELDSLSDAISFGVAPGFVLYLWLLKDTKLGWIAVLVFAVCAALRLARFNTLLEDDTAPKWTKSFFTGIPTPGGAGLVLLPLFLVLEFGAWIQIPAELLAVWLITVGGLMVSRVPTLSMKGRRVPSILVAPVMALAALLVAGLITNTWLVLSGLALAYTLSLPYGWHCYRQKQRHERLEN